MTHATVHPAPPASADHATALANAYLAGILGRPSSEVMPHRRLSDLGADATKLQRIYFALAVDLELEPEAGRPEERWIFAGDVLAWAEEKVAGRAA